MCYGDFCKTVDPNIPILCPECMKDQFYSLTEEELYEMFTFFMDEETAQPTKELFFEAFNKLLLMKREQLNPEGDNDDV